VHTSLPMDVGNNFTSLSVDIHDHLFNQRAHNSFLQSSIAVGVVPHRFEFTGQVLKLFSCRRRRLPSLHLLLDSQFDSLDCLQRLVPPTLQFGCYQAVLRIRRIILFRSAVGSILRCFQVPLQRF
jgi:hypothetical protein